MNRLAQNFKPNNSTVERLKEEVNQLQSQLDKFKYQLEHEPKFNIDDYKDCDADIYHSLQDFQITL